MKLSNFFKSGKLHRDADIELTHFAHQQIKGIVCFALSETYVS